MKPIQHSLQHARGATLVVALIILLVMTIVGVSTMESSTLQERMAANSRQQSLAQNAAETALRTAESWMRANVDSSQDVITFFNGADGLYSALPRPGSVSARPLLVSLDDSAAWAGVGVEVDSLSDSVIKQDPKYVIEFVGRGALLPTANIATQLNSGANAGNNDPYFFRITAIGWGKDTKIYTVLESTYKTGSSDFTY